MPKNLQKKLKNIRGVEQELVVTINRFEEKVRQLECLIGFSSSLNVSLDSKWVVEKTIEATCLLLKCERATLFLLFKDQVSEPLKDQIRDPIREQDRFTAQVIKTAEPLIVNRLNELDQQKLGSEVSNFIVVPLIAKGKVIGILKAINRSSAPSEFEMEDARLLMTLAHQTAIALDNATLYERLKTSFYDTVYALAESIEKKDRYTGGHTKRVVYYSECIAKYLELDEEFVDRLRLSAIIHDVGKIGIEDKILKKAAPLDPYEWPVMRTHPELGFQILGKVRGLGDVVDGMRFHHERWDGTGYPQGLKGEAIPMIARIISVADTYDAMVSTRPYKNGMSAESAFLEIQRHSGTQFCPTVVQAFEQAFKNEKMGKGSGGHRILKSI